MREFDSPRTHQINRFLSSGSVSVFCDYRAATIGSGHSVEFFSSSYYVRSIKDGNVGKVAK